MVTINNTSWYFACSWHYFISNSGTEEEWILDWLIILDRYFRPDWIPSKSIAGLLISYSIARDIRLRIRNGSGNKSNSSNVMSYRSIHRYRWYCTRRGVVVVRRRRRRRRTSIVLPRPGPRLPVTAARPHPDVHRNHPHRHPHSHHHHP